MEIFVDHDLHVTFSTETGEVAYTDPLLLKGVMFKSFRVRKEEIDLYYQMIETPNFLAPIPFSEINPDEYDAILLPGGPASGCYTYMANQTLQRKVFQFFQDKKVIGAVCHGPIILARTIDEKTGKSIIFDKMVTALPRDIEKLSYYLSFWKLGSYYRTYPKYVQDEIMSVLQDQRQFIRGDSIWKPFVVIDENLVTARWPRDSTLLAQTMIEKKKSVLGGR